MHDPTLQARYNHEDHRARHFPMQEMHLETFLPGIIPFMESGRAGQTHPVSLALVTFIKGGFAIAFAMAHAFIDGQAAQGLIELWAAFCRGEGEEYPVPQTPPPMVEMVKSPLALALVESLSKGPSIVNRASSICSQARRRTPRHPAGEIPVLHRQVPRPGLESLHCSHHQTLAATYFHGTGTIHLNQRRRRRTPLDLYHLHPPLPRNARSRHHNINLRSRDQLPPLPALPRFLHSLFSESKPHPSHHRTPLLPHHFTTRLTGHCASHPQRDPHFFRRDRIESGYDANRCASC